MRDLPLADIRILAVSQFGAGPWALSLLADLGADVVKVEAPGVGDEARQYPPFACDGDSIYFQALNLGCRSITIDLRDPRGEEVLRRIVPACEVVYDNLRGREPSRLGLTCDNLRGREPSRLGLTCEALSILNYLAPWNLSRGGAPGAQGGLGAPESGTDADVCDRRWIHRGDAHEAGLLASSM